MKAIDIIKRSIATHKDWAAYFEKHPEMQELEKHKEIGDAVWHRARIKDYEQAISEIEQLQAKLDTARAENQAFGDVLAMVHRDGGHYITEHGHEKASKDAIQVVLDLREELDKHRRKENM